MGPRGRLRRMRHLAWLASLCALAALAACGGNVIVDHNTGGAGGSSSGPGPGSSGPGSNVSSSMGPGHQTSTSHGPSTSVSSATGSGQCDNTGDCASCQECALSGPCLEAWDGCLQDMSCSGLINCFANCQNDQCYDMCWGAFPDGQELYMKLANCVLCEACFNDCAGSGC